MGDWSSSLDASQMIRLSKCSMSDEEGEAALRVLTNEFLGMGKEVQQFEDSLSKFFGRQAVCVANGTSALQLALQACGVREGDEVLVPSLTYVASFQAISATGAKPIACDVNPITLTLDWRDAKKRISSRTKAIMPVHYSGGVGEIKEIYSLAQSYGLRVIEDAAHAFGTQTSEGLVGAFGDIACFSFDGIKNITSGEGGCVVTSDDAILEAIKEARLLGVVKDTEQRYAGKRSWEFDVTTQGWRYHMSDIMAAIGRVQLARFPLLAAKRRRVAQLYDMLFADFKCISVMPHNYDNVVPHIYVIKIHELKNRDSLRGKLLDSGIQTGIHYQPNHLLSFYKDCNIEPLKNLDKIYPTILTLPLHPDLSEIEVTYIAKAVIGYVNEDA
jgi:dTDP-4-amino-4,6-dideoxygalactose transaminase